MERSSANDNFTEDLKSKLRESQSVLTEALEKYERKQVFLSYNGGKDCTVLLHMLSEILGDSIDDFKVIYLRSSEPFQEIEDFVKSCEGFYGINISTVDSDRGMKEVLADICENDKDISAAIMGSRRTDPWCQDLKSFQLTDRGWPSLMRINPMLEWNCANVWEYLLKKKVPYCSLYDVGYSSIGNRRNTRPNPNLASKERPGTFLPAYELLDDSLERAGRFTPKQ